MAIQAENKSGRIFFWFFTGVITKEEAVHLLKKKVKGRLGIWKGIECFLRRA